MTNLEKGLLMAARAFVHHYDTIASINSDMPPPPQQEFEPVGQPYTWEEERGAIQQESHANPTPTSNGVPVCQRHGKPMRLGKFGSYFCTAKESDPRYANKSGYCKYSAKA